MLVMSDLHDQNYKCYNLQTSNKFQIKYIDKFFAVLLIKINIKDYKKNVYHFKAGWTKRLL